MVSELVSNAFQHGEGQICLTVESGPDGVWAQVSDEGCSPAIATPEPRPERGGWGLQFVDRLADAWGVEAERGARLVPHRPHGACSLIAAQEPLAQLRVGPVDHQPAVARAPRARQVPGLDEAGRLGRPCPGAAAPCCSGRKR